MQIKFAIDGSGSLCKLSDLRIQSQRERNPDHRKWLRELVAMLEAGQLPDGWRATEAPEEKDSRAGTGIYGYEW